MDSLAATVNDRGEPGAGKLPVRFDQASFKTPPALRHPRGVTERMRREGRGAGASPRHGSGRGRSGKSSRSVIVGSSGGAVMRLGSGAVARRDLGLQKMRSAYPPGLRLDGPDF